MMMIIYFERYDSVISQDVSALLLGSLLYSCHRHKRIAWRRRHLCKAEERRINFFLFHSL